MVTIGIDAQKRSETVVADDEQGRQLAQGTTGTKSSDHLQLLAWAAAIVLRTATRFCSPADRMRARGARLSAVYRDGSEQAFARARGIKQSQFHRVATLGAA